MGQDFFDLCTAGRSRGRFCFVLMGEFRLPVPKISVSEGRDFLLFAPTYAHTASLWLALSGFCFLMPLLGAPQEVAEEGRQGV